MLFELSSSLGSIKPLAEQSIAAAGGDAEQRPGAGDLAFRQDGRVLAAAWCAQAGRRNATQVAGFPRRACSFAFLAQVAQLPLPSIAMCHSYFFCSWDGRVRLFDSKQGKPLASLKYHAKVRAPRASLSSLCRQGKGRASSGEAAPPRAEVAKPRTQARRIDSAAGCYAQAATAVAFLGPEDGGLATAGRDGAVALWKVYPTATATTTNGSALALA